MEINKEVLTVMYTNMVRIRKYEEELKTAYLEGKSPRFDIGFGPIPGEMHLAAGQEPAAVGICIHLHKDDTVTAPHRPHHAALAKGVDMKKMTAEIYGKDTGLGHGKGGHMHLFDPSVKFSCSGIVGAGFPPAVGAALAAKMQGKNWVAVTFAGEGAANQGSFHESLNLAAMWKLPVVFVIEDNQYAISVPKSASTSIGNGAGRAAAYGLPGHRVADNDVLEMYRVAGEAVARARRGEGPTLIEIETYRYFGHFEGDPELYRPKGEIETLRKKDPIQRLKTELESRGFLSKEEDQRIVAEVEREIREAFEFARQSSYPAPESALQHLFV